MSNSIEQTIQTFFSPIPGFDYSQYASRLHAFVSLLLKTDFCTAQTKHQFEQVQDFLLPSCDNPAPYLVRRELYSALKSHPFFSTLMLIAAPTTSTDMESNMTRCTALLARLFALRNVDDYSAYLQFYKSFLSEDACTIPFTTRFIIESTDEELQLQIKNTSSIESYRSLSLLAPFVQPRTTSVRQVSSKSIINQACIHEQRLESTKEYDLDHLQVTDENANTKSELLGLTSKVALSTQQQRQKYSRRQVGIHNALYRHEARVPWSLHAATPQELGTLVDIINPALIDGNYSEISGADAKFLSILFLKLLKIPDVFNMELINLGARNVAKNLKTPRLEYSLDSRSLYINVSVVLNASLLKTGEPEPHPGHYTHNKTFSYTLPHPLPTLLNIALRNTKNRHQCTIMDAFTIDPRAYSRRLSAALKAAKLATKGVTKTALEKSFFHYAAESTPEVFLNILEQNASVQSHYISAERATLQEVITDAWLNFCRAAGFKYFQSFSAENASRLGDQREYHDEVGSKITIRESVLELILERLTQSLHQESKASISTQVSHLNQCALYIYLRTATTAALRPVNEPYPTPEHFHSALDLFSVADKRSHHSEERRLIFLSSRLSQLIEAYRRAAIHISQVLNMSAPSHLVMYLNGENHCFEHFSIALVNRWFLESTKTPFINHSLRHNAARQFLLHHISNETFSQAALNLLMNHARAGVSALNRRSLPNIASHQATLQALVKPYDTKYQQTDITVLKALDAISGVHHDY